MYGFINEGKEKMAQQKGFKRAIKVAARKKKLKANAKAARARRVVRQAEVKAKEESKKE
jgi:hypothetical protein